MVKFDGLNQLTGPNIVTADRVAIDDDDAVETKYVEHGDLLSRVLESWALEGVISPAALSSGRDDWAPTGLSTASVIRVDLTGGQTITGLTGGAVGRVIILHNIDTSETLSLADESASSAAANRFALPGSETLSIGPESSVVLHYDSTSSRWRVAGGGGTDDVGASLTGNINFTAGAAVLHGTAVAQALQDPVDGTNYPYIRLAYDDSTDEEATFEAIMPEDWDGGALDITVMWSDGGTTANDAIWVAAMDRVEAGAAPDGALTTAATITSTASTTADAIVEATSTGITKPTGLAAGEMFILKLTRDADNASDTLSGDAHVHRIRIEYTRSTA